MAADGGDPVAALGAIPADVAALHRPPRSALFLPLLRRLLGDLSGLHAIELGSGEPLQLARALVEEGMRVTALDPALADGSSPGDRLTLVARDAIDAPPDLAPADLTLSSMLFGAPLRQRARRELWPRYVAGDRPAEAEVNETLADVEARLIDRLAGWTVPGGWSVHWSLEGLFAAPPSRWGRAGFDLVHHAPPWLLARRACGPTSGPDAVTGTT